MTVVGTEILRKEYQCNRREKKPVKIEGFDKVIQLFFLK